MPTRFIVFASFVLVVAVLRLAADVIIPIALAALLAFLLSPLVVRLRRWKLHKVPAVIITVLGAFSILGVVGWVVASQLVDLAQKLPAYERNIIVKIESLQDTRTGGPLHSMMEMVENMRRDLAQGEKDARAAEAQGNPAGEPAPVPVELRAAPSTPLEVLQRVVSPLLGPLGTGGIAIVLFVAMLLQREDLRDRFIKVVSAGRINVATQAVDDAARRVSRYLLMQLIVNATYGFPVGIGLYFIGIPNALLWGLLATVLRFIPFLGPWIAAIFPVSLAFAIAPGWEPLLYTILLFVVMELISNNIVEVWLYGAGTGISNLALLIAAVFWTWVWGPIGLFLSTPMTVCILVMGKYVPGLRFLSMLLGSEPVLEPPAQFYQRMLAMDAEGMSERARSFIKRHSMAEFYDGIFIPALIHAEEDRHRGGLAEVRQKFIFASGRELIDDLERWEDEEEEREEKASPGSTTEATRPPPQIEGRPMRVFILSARDDADELVAAMLQHLLRERGIEVEVSPVNASLNDATDRICSGEFDLVVISAVPPSAVTPARRLTRFVREQCPKARVLVGIWSEEGNVSDLRMRLRQAKPDAVATSIGEAVTLLYRLAIPEEEKGGIQSQVAATVDNPAPEPPPSVPSLELDGAEPESWFDLVSRDLAQKFDVPVSLISVVDFDPQFWASHRGLPADLSEEGRPESVPMVSLNGEDLLVVPDVTKDERLKDSPFLKERGVQFYACAALRRTSGQSVGTLYVIDTKPRQISPEQTALLRHRASEFMESVEKHGHAAARPQGDPDGNAASRAR